MAGTAPTDRERKIQAIVDWMIDGARTVRLPQDILDELCRRLTAVGVPLYRAAVFVRTLHPDIMGRRFLWRPGEEVLVTESDSKLVTLGERKVMGYYGTGAGMLLHGDRRVPLGSDLHDSARI